MRSLPFVALILIVCLPAFVAAQGASQVQLEVHALKIDGRAVEVLFNVADQATGRNLQGLNSDNVKLLEDGTAIAPEIKLVESRTDAANPMSTVIALQPSNGVGVIGGSTAITLSVVGATIGIVFDASKLTNTAGDPTDYVAKGRELIVTFLDAGRPTAASNPEALGLFLPLTVPAVSGEQIRPTALPGFGQDRNAVINVLNQMAPRTGKTNVFDTLSLAVSATADAAAKRGTDAYVLVITDGGDSTSVGSYDALVAEAVARKVRLLILGVGPLKRLAGNAAVLTTLATKTGGAYLGNPDKAAIEDFYRSNVSVTGQSAYTLRYTTNLIDDGASHTLVIRITGAATGESKPISLGLQGSGGTFDLGNAMRGYAMRAIPLAIIISLALTGLLLFLRRIGERGTGSLSGGITRR